MKRKITVLAIACVSVFALAGAAAASAGAATFEPTDGLGFPVPFTSTSGAGKLVSSAATIQCTSDTNLGSITNGTEDKVRVRFKGCTGPFGASCKGGGGGSGEIVTSALRSFLVNLAGGKFGILLLPEGANPKGEYPNGEFVSVECLGITVKVTGGIIGQITSPAKETPSSSFVLNFAESGGAQEFKKVEGETTEYFLRANGGEAKEITGDTVKLCKSTTETKAGEGTCTGERKGQFK
ncbi:MAG TPA: hypothetical protein VGI17_04765 [Solirubrobacterales bacterium]|jgi:hypothetical protein